MMDWGRLACVAIGACLMAVAPAMADEGAAKPAAGKSTVVVDVKPKRIILLEIEAVGSRLVAVGERGFVLISDDAGEKWKAVQTPINRTLTSVAFKDGKVGVAVGHNASIVRTEDSGSTWAKVPMEEAEPDSLLGVAHLGGDHFVAYGAFGLYLDSADAGRTWTRRTIVNEEFDRHISRVMPVGSSVFMVAESGTIARSDDGGVTWVQLESPYPGSYFNMLQTKSGALLIFGMRGNVYRSVDLGATWQKIELATTASLMAGWQLADGSLLLVGNSGLLARSRDDGQTLELHWAPKGQGFADFAELGGKIFTVGETGVAPLDPAWLTDAKTAANR